jgi:hypothetical protein
VLLVLGLTVGAVAVAQLPGAPRSSGTLPAGDMGIPAFGTDMAAALGSVARDMAVSLAPPSCSTTALPLSGAPVEPGTVLCPAPFFVTPGSPDYPIH